MTAPGECESVLPSWHELLAAFTGWGKQTEHLHPVARCACALAHLHRKRCPRGRRSAAVELRTTLIATIDAWVADHLRCPGQLESIGVYIDRMAAESAEAIHLLRTGDAASEKVHEAWWALAVLAVGWTDITLAAVPPYAATEGCRPTGSR